MATDGGLSLLHSSKECEHELLPLTDNQTGSRKQRMSVSLLLSLAFNVLFVFLLSLTSREVAYGTCNSRKLSVEAGYQHGNIPKTEKSVGTLNYPDLSTHAQKLDGRIKDTTSIFRHDPSPEVDAAWDRLSTARHSLIVVDENAVIEAGKLPNMSIKAPLSWGYGADKYLAQIDVFHQIHCLDELRKEMYSQYYYGAQWNATFPPPLGHMEHKKHCLHILLQNVMCHADMDIITHNWVHYDNIDEPDRPYAEPLADFSIIKQCRDFETLLNWAFENAVDDLGAKWHALKMPKGATLVQGDGYF